MDSMELERQRGITIQVLLLVMLVFILFFLFLISFLSLLFFLTPLTPSLASPPLPTPCGETPILILLTLRVTWTLL